MASNYPLLEFSTGSCHRIENCCSIQESAGRLDLPVSFPPCSLILHNGGLLEYTVKPVNTGMPWGQTFIPVWTGSGLERVLAFGEEQTRITCTIDMRAIIQDVSSVGLQMIGG